MLVIFTVTLMLVVGRHAAKDRAASGQPLTSHSLQGAAAPDFELKTIDGKTVHLSDYKGKAVLLNFWATWCPPCKIEMPWFVDLQKQYGGQGLQVIGVAMDDVGPDAIRKFASDLGVNYPILIGKESVADLYGGMQFLPTTFYIDRQGKIVDRVFGLVSHSEIEGDVKKALSSATASK